MAISFEQTDILASLEALDDIELDTLDFGVIGFTGDIIVCRYNTFEAKLAGLRPVNALGKNVFTELAQCMNNFLVAVRFEDAITEGASLDATIDFILSWRMRPTKVQLRLLYSPGCSTRYILIKGN
jgi:photoactive yellow protein